jgi:hypothetical protein
VVPSVARFVGAVGDYDPQAYEPKDFARQSWLQEKVGRVGLDHVDMIVHVLLFLLVAIVWLGLVPPGASRRR